ncbi:DUF3253 domain containing protein [Sulfitobacter noctilucae]|uniref:DUF3253 domain-containing protein n=1 Tax=Sulfitobacter noctilucae TaxID=1342302 RepID=UPI0004692CB4|nr:DUF3253 domain-containing protein [Sulfitobacter noctilucae]KIN65862.1 DUF3253 domain containing protein [Sulfitobacter noctilucae]
MTDRDTLIRATLDLTKQRGPDKTICPSEVARHIGGADERTWRPLMGPMREVAAELAKAGKIDIKKGGEVVDPDTFSGIYRIAIKD